MIKIPDNVYDILKYAAIIGIPALATFYRALAGIWGLPGAEEVPATLNAIETLLGALLCVSAAEYNKRIDGT